MAVGERRLGTRAKVLIGLGVAALVWASAFAFFAVRLRSSDWHVRDEAASMLGTLPLPGGDRLNALADENEATYGPFVPGCFNWEGAGMSANVRGSCVRSLGQRRAREAESVVLRIALDQRECDWVRWCAIRALANIGSDACVDDLVTLLSEEPGLGGWGYVPSAPEALAETLRAITGQDRGPDPKAWKAWRAWRRGPR